MAARTSAATLAPHTGPPHSQIIVESRSRPGEIFYKNEKSGIRQWCVAPFAWTCMYFGSIASQPRQTDIASVLECREEPKIRPVKLAAGVPSSRFR